MKPSTQKLIHLNDADLLDHCMKVIGELRFLTNASRQLLEKLASRADMKPKPKSNADFLSECQEIDKLWVELLIDAIHALKIRDRREKARQNNFHAKEDTEQQAARDQNVFGIVKLKEYFEDFNQFESVLYGIDGSYRDHVTHVIRVWLIGICLLTSKQQDNKPGIDSLDLRIQALPETTEENQAIEDLGSLSQEERWAMWTIVALCHDLGYPLEQARKVNDAIDRMLAHFGDVSTSRYSYTFHSQNQMLNDATLRILSSKAKRMPQPNGTDESEIARLGKYTTSIQTKYHTKFSHSLEEFRHGIISCLVLMKTLVFFMETDYDMTNSGSLCLEDARQFLIRCEILRAIASHTCTDIYHLKLASFPFLLLVCDELQEWGRPTFREMKLGRGHSSGASEVLVQKCDFASGIFNARLKYGESDGPNITQVLSKFKMFHKLLRAALDDSGRRLAFEWEIISDDSYKFTYDSSRGAFQELSVSQGAKIITADLYRREEPQKQEKAAMVAARHSAQ